MRSQKSTKTGSRRIPLTITLDPENYAFIESCVSLKEFDSVDKFFDAACVLLQALTRAAGLRRAAKPQRLLALGNSGIHRVRNRRDQNRRAAPTAEAMMSTGPMRPVVLSAQKITRDRLYRRQRRQRRGLGA
jgi:hypothetical protein